MSAKSNATTPTEYLQNAPQQYIKCRLVGHARSENIKLDFYTEGSGRDAIHIIELVCPDCGTIRQFRRDWKFNHLPGRYIYPDGYVTTGLDMSKENIYRFQFTGHAEPTQANVNGNGRRSTRSRRGD